MAKRKVDRSIPYSVRRAWDMQRIHEEEKRKQQEQMKEKFDLALLQDSLLLAAHDILGVSKGRVIPLCNKFIEYKTYLAEMLGSDFQEDKDLVYSKAKIDEMMEKIYGNAFVPFDMRYGLQPIPADTYLNVDEKGNKIYPDLGVFITAEMAPEGATKP